jgi:hypothetical protein
LQPFSLITSPPSSHVAAEEPKLGRGMRVKRPTWKVLEMLPEPPIPVEELSAVPAQHSPSEEPAPGFVWQAVKSVINTFGLYREFPSSPSYCPDDMICLEDLTYPTMQQNTDNPPSHLSARPFWAPFTNLSSFLLVNWLWSGSQLKSIGEIGRLVHALRTPGFSVADLEHFDAARETALLDSPLSSPSSSDPDHSPFTTDYGWKSVDITIEVPDGRQHRPHRRHDPPIPTFTIPELRYRSITSVIRTVWASDMAKNFHITPFRQHWRRDAEHTERVYSELYASDAFAKAYEDVQNLLPEDDCSLERTVCALMFWSDSTHLTNFGSASLWPLYLFFGNESKYTRASMSHSSCHHIAYIPKVCWFHNNAVLADLLTSA